MGNETSGCTENDRQLRGYQPPSIVDERERGWGATGEGMGRGGGGGKSRSKLGGKIRHPLFPYIYLPSFTIILAADKSAKKL